MMPIPKDLARAADRFGLVVEERGKGHFQILGGVLKVNYYPESRRRSAYIEGMTAAHHHVTPEQAVSMAFTPKPLPRRDERQKSYRKIKRKLYRRSDLCYCCKRPILVFADATLEHIIPLSKGGLDNENNMALSHERCNRERADRMPKGRS
jgi:5-methylcytosine-specific restriction endonuclease McrA